MCLVFSLLLRSFDVLSCCVCCTGFEKISMEGGDWIGVREMFG